MISIRRRVLPSQKLETVGKESVSTWIDRKLRQYVAQVYEAIAYLQKFSPTHAVSVDEAAAGQRITGPPWPAFNNASKFDSYGDSITIGAAGTTSSANGYVNLLAQARGWIATNHAVNGSMVADQADYVYVNDVDNYQQSTLMLGTNDLRFYKEDFYKMLCYERGHRALVAWLAIPHSQKLIAQDLAAVAAGTLVYSGAWSDNVSVYGGDLGRYSSSVGAKVTAYVYGSVVYLATIIIDTGTSTFSVKIDGVQVGLFANACGGGGNIVSINGRSYMPQLLRFGDLSEDTHEVVIEVISVGVNPIYFDWAAGNLGNATKDGPNVWVLNIPRLAAAGYATYGGTDNGTVSMYNEIIRRNVDQLSDDGLNVALVDSQSRFNNQTMLDADGIHPNDTGQAAIGGALLEPINQAAKPGSRLTRAPESLIVLPAGDQTPSLARRGSFLTDSGAYTITGFRDGSPGRLYAVLSGGVTTFDTTSSQLFGSSADLVTAAGDATLWLCQNQTTFWLCGFVDSSVNNSGGA